MVDPNKSSGVGTDFLFINHWLEEVQQAMILVSKLNSPKYL